MHILRFFDYIFQKIPRVIVSLLTSALSKHLWIYVSIALYSLVKGSLLLDIFTLFRFLSSKSDMTPGTITSTSENPMETHNLALASTFVVQGRCTGVVFATGDRTIIGRIVALSGETTFKLTTMQKEVWFFTKIISAVALTLFCISILIWGVWLRKAFPGFATASGAIINSIGCLTAFVPQVDYCQVLFPTRLIPSFWRVYRCALRSPWPSSLGEWLLAMFLLRTLRVSKH